MKKLDIYLLKELSVPLIIGTVVFALLFMANDTIFIYKSFNVDAVPPLAILQLLLFKFPFWLNVTLPIGTSLGCSLAVSRLARESELTAMRAAGISVFRAIRPVIFVGALMALANFLVVEKLVPPSSKAYRRLMNEVGVLASIPPFRSNVMISIDRFSASFGSIQRGKLGSVLLTDIVMLERPRPGEMILYKSMSGTYQDGIWKIKAPTILHLKGAVLLAAETKDQITINEPIRVTDLFSPPAPEEQSSADLADSIRQAKEAQQLTTALEVSYYQKFSVPVACLIFAFTAAVLAVRFAKAGPFIGVMLSLGLVWLYFNVYVITGDIFGKYAWVPPVAAAWLPNVLFGLFGLIFVRRLE